MTRHEKRLAAELLRMAAEAFCNRTCNDYDLAKVIADPDVRDALAREAFEDYEPAKPDPSGPDMRIPDWLLMSLIAGKLEREAESA